MGIQKFFSDEIPQSDKEDVVTGINAVQFYLKNQEELVFKKFRLNSLDITLVSITSSTIGHIWDFIPRQGAGNKERTRGFIISHPRDHSQEVDKKKVYVSEIKKQAFSYQKEQPHLEEAGKTVREAFDQVVKNELVPKLVVIVDFPEQKIIVYSLTDHRGT